MFDVTRKSFGDHGEGETPGSIPNPEAKPFSADGTALVKVWESRTSPDNYSKMGHLRVAHFCVVARFHWFVHGQLGIVRFNQHTVSLKGVGMRTAKVRYSLLLSIALVISSAVIPLQVSSASANSTHSSASLSVTFGSESSALTGPAKMSLRSFYSNHKSDKSLSITGYVQRSHVTSNDRSLSLRRAKAIQRYLKQLGFKGSISVKAGRVPRNHPWAASSRKAVVKVVASGQPSQPASAGLSITVKADAITATYAELTASYIWTNGGYWNQTIDSRSRSLSVNAGDNYIHFTTTGSVDYQVKVNNRSSCPVVQEGMSAYFNCQNLKNGDTINIAHDPISTVRVKMADSALSLGQQVASYYTGPTGSAYQDGMTSQQDIQVGSGAHDFNIVIYYTNSDLFIVYLNNATLCPFDGTTSSTYKCPGVKAGDVVNVYAAHCPNPALRIQEAQRGNVSDRSWICVKR